MKIIYIMSFYKDSIKSIFVYILSQMHEKVFKKSDFIKMLTNNNVTLYGAT